MDDDVTVFIESFFRTYSFLSVLKAQHSESYLAGAMLKDNEMDVQHENLGFIQKHGWYEPKNGDAVLDNYMACSANDTFWPNYGFEYAGWWYCCIPMSCISEDSLPLPLFIRGDDVEFALRNKAEILTLNGICVWHGSFDAKFSAQMELYQVLRNSLIIQACHEYLAPINFFEYCMVLFDRQCVEFQYDYANMILDAVEDFMQGPSIIEKPNGLDKIKEKGKFNEKLVPVEELGLPEDTLKGEEIIHRINYLRFRIMRKINTWSYNGQLHLKFLVGNKTGIVFHDWAFYAENVFMRKELVAVDVHNDKAIIRKRNPKAFKKVYDRRKKLVAKYKANKESIEKSYKDAYPKLTGIDFWKNYLGID
ncbi:MAG: hypothetical protein HUJ63_11110 [Enterococcus sp.]|nr:hypothetical protein [Enterococcus sp.]